MAAIIVLSYRLRLINSIIIMTSIVYNRFSDKLVFVCVIIVP